MSLLEDFKSIVKSVSDAGNHELYQELNNISKEIYEITLENMQLKEEIRMIKQKQDENAIKVFKDGAYYFGDDGPYCTNCYDDLGKKIRLHERDNGVGTIHYDCPKCEFRTIKNKYKYEPPHLDPIIY